jgi:hypothetical protein
MAANVNNVSSTNSRYITSRKESQGLFLFHKKHPDPRCCESGCLDYYLLNVITQQPA